MEMGAGCWTIMIEPDECARAVLGVTRQSNHCSLNNSLSSSESGPSQVPSQVPHRWAPRFPWEIVHILKKFGPRLRKKESRPVAHRAALLIPKRTITSRKGTMPPSKPHIRLQLQYSLGKSVHSEVVHFLSVRHHLFFLFLFFLFFLFRSFFLFFCISFFFFLFFLSFLFLVVLLFSGAQVCFCVGLNCFKVSCFFFFFAKNLFF